MLQTIARSDKRKSPQIISYEVLTFDECKALASASHCKILDRHGHIAEVRITSVKSWKTRPNELEVHCKYGLYEYFTVRIDREHNPNTELVRVIDTESTDEQS